MAEEHIIQKQILQVDLPSREAAVSAQTRLEQVYEKHLLPLMDRLFSDVCGPETIVLDRVEIDVGRISDNHLEEELSEKLSQMLTDRLLSELHKNGRQFSGNGDPNTSGGKGDPHIDKLNGSNLNDTSIKSALLYFLDDGRLPWWSKASSPKKIVEELMRENSFKLSSLLHEILHSEIRTDRFIYQIPDNLIVQLLDYSALQKNRSSDIADLLTDLIAVHRKKPILYIRSEQLRRHYWNAVFEFWFASLPQNRSKSELSSAIKKGKIPGRSNRSSDPQLVTFFIHFLLKLTPFARPSTSKKRRTGNRKYVIKSLIAELKRRTASRRLPNRPLGTLVRTLPDEEKHLRILTKKSGSFVKSSGSFKNDSKNGRDTPTQVRSKNRWFDDVESIDVQNAGMVILAPFLPMFFDELGLLDNKQFTDEQAAIRAASILQYVCTGDKELPEHDMVLNKCLCDLPFETPIPGYINLSETEAEEVENLLNSLLKNWKALKSTSIHGLRSTFIHRPGLLKKMENGWSLYIERETVDVLLDHLPWSISIIKLPWNEDPIYVVW